MDLDSRIIKMRIITDVLRSDTDVAKIADHLGISHKYSITLFKEQTGRRQRANDSEEYPVKW